MNVTTVKLPRIGSRQHEVIMSRYPDSAEGREHAARDAATLRRAGVDVIARDTSGEVIRCNCECGYCDHPRGCFRAPSGTFTTDWVGDICDHCAQVMISTGGGDYVKLASEVI